jgi:adenine phosphoribosyltransferase
MSLELLKEQLRKAKIIKKGDYRYILNAITEQEPALEPSILDDCAEKLIKKLNLKNATKILTAETMGVPISTVISLKTKLPLVIATKRKKGTFDEISVDYICGYENGSLHINNIKKEERILIIDDLISTGGTIISLIEGVKKSGAKIEDIGAIFNKVDYGGMRELQRRGFQPKVLLDVKLDGKKIEVKDV